MNPTDIPAYMAHVGVAARAAATGDGRGVHRGQGRRRCARWPPLRASRRRAAAANALDLQAARAAGLAGSRWSTA
jgi:glutamate-5-semialdehyde dehydrogenase